MRLQQNYLLKSRAKILACQMTSSCCIIYRQQHEQLKSQEDELLLCYALLKALGCEPHLSRALLQVMVCDDTRYLRYQYSLSISCIDQYKTPVTNTERSVVLRLEIFLQSCQVYVKAKGMEVSLRGVDCQRREVGLLSPCFRGFVSEHLKNECRKSLSVVIQGETSIKRGEPCDTGPAFDDSTRARTT